MFKNKTDRLNYGNLLMPPMGYELTKAVVTTYSLDLETLTAASIALGVQESTDSVVSESPVALLRALQKVTDKVVVFCESGQTKLPNNASPLVLLLEKMIVPVALVSTSKSGSSYPSFHPKTWILEYENAEGEKLYHFIVMSRNLTFDRSWDITFMMQGTKKIGGKRHMKPLISFLEFLKTKINENTENSDKQLEIVENLQNELQDVKFEIDRKEFSDFEFMPIGIGKEGKDMSSTDLFYAFPDGQHGKNFQELTVMSPFLSTDVVEYLNSDSLSLNGTRRKLFTRRSELPKIKDVAGNFDVYVLKDTIIDGEEALSDEEERERKQQDLHAKIYLRRKNTQNELYLGSMNASNSGLNRNVEMMIKLDVSNQYTNMDKMCQDLFAGDEDNKYNPFEKVNLEDVDASAEDDEDKELEKALKKICRLKSSAEVSQNGNKYTLNVRFEESELPDNVEIRPLRVETFKSIGKEVVFDQLDLLHLSELYVVKVKSKESENDLCRVIMIPTLGIPDERDKEIVQGVIKDKKSFIEYVSMSLGDDLLELFCSEQEEQGKTGAGKNNQNVKMPALYEKMLTVAGEDPRKLLEIDAIMNMIDDNHIITEDFREMYSTFKSAMKL